VLIEPDGGAAPSTTPTYAQLLHAQTNVANGTGTLADQGVIMQGSAANLVAAAGSGFGLSPEGAAPLIASIQESLHILDGIESNLVAVRRAPQLGTLPAARTASNFTHGVANDHQGIVQGVLSLKATLNQMLDAYQKAVANYHAVEQQVTDSVNQLGQAVHNGTLPPPSHGRIRAV
jgi:hypothetical protein